MNILDLFWSSVHFSILLLISYYLIVVDLFVVPNVDDSIGAFTGI